MSEINIDTSRGISLAADFVVPVDSSNCAVIFAHSFLLDRHNLGWFDIFANPIELLVTRLYKWIFRDAEKAMMTLSAWKTRLKI